MEANKRFWTGILAVLAGCLIVSTLKNTIGVMALALRVWFLLNGILFMVFSIKMVDEK